MSVTFNEVPECRSPCTRPRPSSSARWVTLARIRILELLAERDHAVHELLDQIDIEASNLSQQLAVLRRAGLVTPAACRSRGRLFDQRAGSPGPAASPPGGSCWASSMTRAACGRSSRWSIPSPSSPAARERRSHRGSGTRSARGTDRVPRPQPGPAAKARRRPGDAPPAAARHHRRPDRRGRRPPARARLRDLVGPRCRGRAGDGRRRGPARRGVRWLQPPGQRSRPER